MTELDITKLLTILHVHTLCCLFKITVQNKMTKKLFKALNKVMIMLVKKATGK